MRPLFGSILATLRPSNATLVGAQRWLGELSIRSIESASQVFRDFPQYRDLTPGQYNFALDWLQNVGAVNRAGEVLPHLLERPSTVLELFLLEEQPAWLADADHLVKSVLELPLDVIEVAEMLGLSPEIALEEVSRAWRKFDDRHQREVGLIGEVLFADLLSSTRECSVTRVSEFDDSMGYDILATGPNNSAHVELKSTTRAGRVTFYLSRNEFETMNRDLLWCLQVVRLSTLRDAIDKVWWVPASAIRDSSPEDQGEGRWQSCRFDLVESQLHVGFAPQVDSIDTA